MNSKHSQDSSDTATKNESNFVMDKTILKDLLTECIVSLSKDTCYPEDLRSTISNYDKCEIASSLLLKDVQTLTTKLSTKGDAEKYYTNFYRNIIFRPEAFFQTLRNLFVLC